MQSKEDAIEQIQKLLNLGNSPYIEEAQIALKKAHRLMIKFHVDEMELNRKEEKVESQTFECAKYMIGIYKSIAVHTRCDAYHSYGWRNGRRYHEVSIVGFPVDVETVKIMGKFCNDLINRTVSELRKKLRSGESVKINGNEYRSYDRNTTGLLDIFVDGFDTGLKNEFAKIDAENQKYALVMVIPKEVNEYMSNLNFGKSYTVKYEVDTETINHQLAYALGFETGKVAGSRQELGAGCDDNN